MMLPESVVRGGRTAQRDPLDLLYPDQRQMVEAAIQRGARVADHSGRGSGKTEGLAHGCQRILMEEPTAPIAWVGLTRKSAIDNVWPVMRRVNDELGGYLTPRAQDARFVTPKGGMFAVFGANKADEIEKLRGKKWRLVVIDESASFRKSLLKYVVEDVLEPRLVDLDGGLATIGSPGLARAGYYFKICQGKDGYEVYRRTMRDNPFLPDVDAWIERQLERKGWTRDHPTFQREILGLWVNDTDSAVFKLSRERNLIDAMPEDYAPGSPDWQHVLWHDYGVVDSTAWGLWAWRKDRSENRLYLVESFKWWGEVPEEYTDGLSIPRSEGIIGPDAAKISKRLHRKYRPIATVGDSGGIGKDFIEIARRQYGVPIVPAPKMDKLGQFDLYNDVLRSGQALIVECSNRDLIEEMQVLQWAVKQAEVNIQGVVRYEERKDVDKRSEDHLCDGSRYGLVTARQYMNQLTERPPKPKPDVGSEIRRNVMKRIDKRRKQAWWEQVR